MTRVMLKNLQQIHKRVRPAQHHSPPNDDHLLPEPLDLQGQAANDQIKRTLATDRPGMISRVGSSEMHAVLRYMEIAEGTSFWRKSAEFIRGQRHAFWFTDDHVMDGLTRAAGVFPATEAMALKFGARMLEDLPLIDVLGSWLPQERRLRPHLSPDLIRVSLGDLEPFGVANPWSEILAGKKVLVIHPFEESIRKQYARRELLFRDPRILPEFELKTLKAVLSLAGTPVDFPDWFAALESMCQQVDKIDFEIAIIGAGAYGLPLAAHVKRRGKKAVHIGGATQLLFGIMGKRWENFPHFQSYPNEYWVRPLPSETPAGAGKVEGGTYW